MGIVWVFMHGDEGHCKWAGRSIGTVLCKKLQLLQNKATNAGSDTETDTQPVLEQANYGGGLFVGTYGVIMG